MEVLLTNNHEHSYQPHLVKRMRGVALLCSPLLFLLSEIVHPVSQAETSKELASVASHSSEWLTAHLLALGAVVLLPFAAAGLLELADRRFRTLRHVAAALTSIGITCISGLLAFDLVTWQMAVDGSREEMIKLYDRVTQSPGFSLPFQTVAPLLLVLGLLLFSVILFRSKTIWKWQSVFLGIGIFLYGLAGPVFPVANGPLLVISGAVLMTVSLGLEGLRNIFAGRED